MRYFLAIVLGLASAFVSAYLSSIDTTSTLLVLGLVGFFYGAALLVFFDSKKIGTEKSSKKVIIFLLTSAIAYIVATLTASVILPILFLFNVLIPINAGIGGFIGTIILVKGIRNYLGIESKLKKPIIWGTVLSAVWGTYALFSPSRMGIPETFIEYLPLFLIWQIGMLVVMVGLTKDNGIDANST